MKWVYGDKQGHGWTGLHLVETETKGYRVVVMLAQLYYLGLEMGLKGLGSKDWKQGITLVLQLHLEDAIEPVVFPKTLLSWIV